MRHFLILAPELSSAADLAKFGEIRSRPPTRALAHRSGQGRPDRLATCEISSALRPEPVGRGSPSFIRAEPVGRGLWQALHTRAPSFGDSLNLRRPCEQRARRRQYFHPRPWVHCLALAGVQRSPFRPPHCVSILTFAGQHKRKRRSMCLCSFGLEPQGLIGSVPLEAHVVAFTDRWKAHRKDGHRDTCRVAQHGMRFRRCERRQRTRRESPGRDGRPAQRQCPSTRLERKPPSRGSASLHPQIGAQGLPSRLAGGKHRKGPLPAALAMHRLHWKAHFSRPASAQGTA